jgi:hypothetical protein
MRPLIAAAIIEFKNGWFVSFGTPRRSLIKTKAITARTMRARPVKDICDPV